MRLSGGPLVLPIFKNKQKQVAGLIIKQRAPDEKTEGQEPEENDSAAAIEACARDLIMAVHAHDIQGAAEAMKAAFEILEASPHEEGEHTEPHSYDAQNKKAAE